MTAFSDHPSSQFVKLILVGDSGCGKTGALTSLIKAGYELRIIDLDNGLDALRNHCLEECPELLSSVQYHTFTDVLAPNAVGQMEVKGMPRAFTRSMKAIDKWPDDGSRPSEWGPKRILVIDSLTSLSQYAYLWAKKNKPKLNRRDAWTGVAQECIMDMIYALTGDNYKLNLIIISHIDWRGGIHEVDEERKQLPEKGYVMSIGKALGPRIPSRFNTVLESRIVGTGNNAQRKIHVIPRPMLDLKNPAPARMGKGPYPIETGLADIFKNLKGED